MSKLRFALVLVTLLLSTRIPAQSTTPALERVLNLQVSNASIEVILNKISIACGCKFSYNPSAIGSQKITSLQVKNKSVRESLNLLFANQVNYKARGNYIILQKKSEAELKAAKKNVVVKGYVTDANTGQKVPFATIYDKKSLGSANSDDYGYYELKLKNDRELQLNINKQNYSDTIIIVKQDADELINVAIYPSKADTTKMEKIGNRIKKSTVDFLISARQKVNSLNVRDTLSRKWQVSLVPYVGTNLMMSGNVKNDFSLNVIGGYSQGTRLLEMGGVVNMDRGDVGKVQVAGCANLVAGNVSGVQLAGCTNINKHGFYGLQSAGFLNLNNDSSCGVQLAGFLNVNHAKMNGVQAAGFANVNSNSEVGILLAGFTNVNRGDYTGVQLAGFGNNHKGILKGVQVAGFYNSTQGEINGVQVAGFINYAKKVNDFQLGIINISDSCSGVPLGIFSYVKSGYHRIEIAADQQLYYSAAFRTGTKRLYNIFTAATQVNTLQGKSDLWTLGYGMGTSFQAAKKIQVNLDLTAHQFVSESSISSYQTVGKLALSADFYIVPKFSIFIGPVLNVAILDKTDKEFYSKVLSNLPTPNYLSNLNSSQQLRGWLGVKAGIRFL